MMLKIYIFPCHCLIYSNTICIILTKKVVYGSVQKAKQIILMLIFQTLCFKTFKNEAKLLGDTDADGTKGTLDRRIFVLLALFRMDGEGGGR